MILNIHIPSPSKNVVCIESINLFFEEVISFKEILSIINLITFVFFFSKWIFWRVIRSILFFIKNLEKPF